MLDTHEDEICRDLGYLAWGHDPGAFHLYCAAVHALASVLLALAARSLGGLLLAWGLQKIGQALVRQLATGGYAFYGAVLLALGAVSYSHLKKAESLSYYSIGRFYFLQGDFACGISLLQRAIAEGARTRIIVCAASSWARATTGNSAWPKPAWPY